MEIKLPFLGRLKAKPFFAVHRHERILLRIGTMVITWRRRAKGSSTNQP
jgi:hypothetical protein